MKKLIIATGMIFALMPIAPCFASSLPAAEIAQKIGISIGPSFSVDWKMSNNMSIGGSFGSPIYRGLFQVGRYDVRLLYKFLEGDLSLSGLIGVAGDPVFNGDHQTSLAGLELGIALSYAFTPELTGRLNIVGGVPILSLGDNLGYLAPASGFELGYKFTSNLEGTIGANGQGDFLGLNIYF